MRRAGVNMSNKLHNNSPAAQNNEATWKCLLKLGQVTDMETGSIFRMGSAASFHCENTHT